MLFGSYVQEEEAHADAKEDAVKLGVGLIDKYFENHEVLGREHGLGLPCLPYDAEVQHHAKQHSSSHERSSCCACPEPATRVDQPRQHKENLHLARRKPAPEETTLVGNYIIGYEIDRHGEDRPPVLAAVGKTILVGEPAGTVSQKWPDLPAEHEHEVVDWRQSQVAVKQQLQVVDESQPASLGLDERVDFQRRKKA